MYAPLLQAEPGELVSEVAFNDPLATLLLVVGTVLMLFSIVVFAGLTVGGLLSGAWRELA